MSSIFEVKQTNSGIDTVENKQTKSKQIKKLYNKY